MRGQYKVFIPLEQEQYFGRPKGSPKGKWAAAWQSKWQRFLNVCKSLQKSGVRYEVYFHLAAEPAYAEILAGAACRQHELFQEAA